MPDDCSFRLATADDFPLHARLAPALENNDPPPVKELWLAQMAPTTLVAERDGRPLGTIFWQVFEGSGYVRTVVVDPSARRTGVGRAMMLEVRRRLLNAGCATWRLNVKPKNHPAVALYRSLGFSRAYSSASFWVAWETLERLPPPEVPARRLAPQDDRAVEQAFSLPTGQLTEGRSHGRVVLAVGTPVRSVCLFAPTFPGSFPFRAHSAADAHALLDQMRAHSLPGATRAGVVVEDDPALAQALTTAGAQLRDSFDHYVGPLA